MDWTRKSEERGRGRWRGEGEEIGRDKNRSTTLFLFYMIRYDRIFYNDRNYNNSSVRFPLISSSYLNNHIHVILLIILGKKIGPSEVERLLHRSPYLKPQKDSDLAMVPLLTGNIQWCLVKQGGEWDTQQTNMNFLSLKMYRLSIYTSLTSGRFQQEAHMSNFQDQRKAIRANSVHERLATGIIAIKCQGRYTCSKLGRKKWADILLSP